MGAECSTQYAYKCSVAKPEGNRPLGRFMRRWENNIKMDFIEMRWFCVDWVHLV
jgi:hypothetical protein